VALIGWIAATPSPANVSYCIGQSAFSPGIMLSALMGCCQPAVKKLGLGKLMRPLASALCDFH
jgi:hypothetical protein